MPPLICALKESPVGVNVVELWSIHYCATGCSNRLAGGAVDNLSVLSPRSWHIHVGIGWRSCTRGGETAMGESFESARS